MNDTYDRSYIGETQKPECYQSEDGNPYPLCVGDGSNRCKNCGLFNDYERFHDPHGS